MNESTFRWILYNLPRKQLLFRIDYDAYVTSKPTVLPEYTPIYTDLCQTMIAQVEQQYPDIDFVAFESMLLNEFLNR